MQSSMLALSSWLGRRRRLIVGLWVVALLVALPFAARQSDELTGGGFGVPGSESQQVDDALERDFETATRANLAAVFIAEEGASRSERTAAFSALREAVGEVDDVALPAGAARRAQAAARGRERVAIVPLAIGVSEQESSDVAIELRDALGIGDSASEGAITTHLVGQGALWAGLQDLSKEDLEQAEITGFPFVALILLFVFGSLAAAALPLTLGFVSVLITGALIYLLSRSMEMSVFTTNMASMIGIGVAVDYSLFVLARYREEIRDGRDPEAARGAALATSGVAVIFSGLAVMASLAGLLIIDSTAMRSMAIGAILVVGVSVLAAATLLPALMAMMGRRAYARGRLFTAAPLVVRSWRPRRRGSTTPEVREANSQSTAKPSTFWERWTVRVMRRPLLSVLASATVLLTLAVPALSLTTADGALQQFPASHETRVGFEAAAAAAGPGASAPIQVLAPAAEADAVRAALQRDPGIASVQGPVPSERGDRVQLLAASRSDGESAATNATVERLRDALPGTGTQVGGSSAGLVDFHDLVSGSMWKIVLFVLLLSYIVLLVLLRSLLLPLKAVLMNLLSVGAAYGVVVAVFQYGWLDGLLGYDSPGYVDTITPALVLAVVFGLSMDYEVFLLSRIRERFAAGADTTTAVAGGLSSSAKTITSAALIMVGVFAVFVGTGVPSIQQLGLGCAVAIALDVTLVRLVLVPAAMALMGRWNWWLPRPLQRLLPEIDTETLRTGKAAV